jgi:hypothetical protein
LNRLSKIALRTLGFALLVLGLSAALHAQHGRSWMNGVVYGESDTQGLAGATVELTGDPNSPVVSSMKLSAKTDDGGKYYLQGVTAGEYTFRVSAPGFTPYQIPVYIATDSLTALHVKLRKEPAK